MICEDYKLAIAADPAFDGGADHVAECADCTQFTAEMRSLNVSIAKALDLSVPTLQMPQLPDVDADNVVSMAPRRTMTAPAWLAIAASVMLAAFIGFQVGNVEAPVETPNESLSNQVLAHMDHEPYALKVTTDAVSDARLARVVPAKIATMNHNAGLITYAQTCQINGHEVPHLVIQGKNGPITILLMPNEAVAAAQDINGTNIQGVILPVGGGSIAIVGASDEELEGVKNNLLDSVSWGT